VDAAGEAYATGSTCSTDFPTTPGALQTIYGGGACFSDGNGFVTKLNASGSSLVYSTYLGESSASLGVGVAVDTSEDAYITGQAGNGFPVTPGAFQTNYGGDTDAFIAELNPAGSALIYATYLGGSGGDSGSSIAVGGSGSLYAVGGTNSVDFPITPNSFQQSFRGGAEDAFVVALLPGDQVWPLTLSFGDQPVGIASALQTAALTNSSSTTLDITSISVSGDNGTLSQTNTCGSSLAVGASCTISISWTPSVPGPMTGTLTITDNAPNSPQTVALTGTGTQPAVMLSPTSLTFSTQVVFTSSKAQNVTLTNTGTGTLAITSIAATGQFSQTNTCGTSVAPGASCAISVTFKPRSKGTLTGTIMVTDNAPGSPQEVTLSGCGTYLQLTPSSVNFGNQPVHTTSPPKKVTVSNKGSSTVTITSIAISGRNSGDFAETNTCRSSLAPGATCSVSVTFTPVNQGKRTAELSFSDNAGCSPQTVGLSGTGTP